MSTSLSPRVVALAAVTCAASITGCRAIGDGTLTDTQGVQVRYSATEERIVSTENTPPAVHCDATTSVAAEWGLRGLRLITLCPLVRAEFDAIECRPLVCNGDHDCPPSTSLEPIACEAGFCVRSTETWTDRDVIALCLADTPRLTDCANFFAYAATALVAVDPALERHCGPTGDCAAPIACGP